MTAIYGSPFPSSKTAEAPWDEVDVTIVETQICSPAFETGWRPAVNAYRCGGRFVIFVDLAGVDRDSIELAALPRRLAIRGRRHVPEPNGDGTELCQLLAFEIDHGWFERALELPLAIDPDAVVSAYEDGLLRIELPLAA